MNLLLVYGTIGTTMLYRHLPKIANKEFSILTLDVSGTEKAHLTALIESAIRQGIRQFYAGAIAETAKKTREILDKTAEAHEVVIIVEPACGTQQDLARFMAESACGKRDLLILKPAMAAFCGSAAASFMATGFRASSEKDSVSEALRSGFNWHFWATDYHYAREDISAEIEEAARAELSFFAFDPFYAGLLENPPAPVHDLFFNAPVPRSKDEWAMRAIFESQNVVSAVWKAPTAADIERKTLFSLACRANSLPEKELRVIREAGSIIRSRQY